MHTLSLSLCLSLSLSLSLSHTHTHDHTHIHTLSHLHTHAHTDTHTHACTRTCVGTHATHARVMQKLADETGLVEKQPRGGVYMATHPAPMAETSSPPAGTVPIGLGRVSVDVRAMPYPACASPSGLFRTRNFSEFIARTNSGRSPMPFRPCPTFSLWSNVTVGGGGGGGEERGEGGGGEEGQ
jgi:hypothetical protein